MVVDIASVLLVRSKSQPWASQDRASLSYIRRIMNMHRGGLPDTSKLFLPRQAWLELLTAWNGDRIAWTDEWIHPDPTNGSRSSAVSYIH